MKKLMLAVICITIMLSGMSQAAKITQPASLDINVQEGIELLSVIQYLGSQLSNSTPSVYKQDLKKYFLQYRNHPAVIKVFMFEKNIYPDLTECGMLFYNFPDIKMHAMPDSSLWYRYIPKAELEQYFQLCMTFYKDARFHQYYTSHQSMYQQWAGELRKKMDEPVRIFSSVFSENKALHWQICLDALNDWGAHTIVPSKLLPGMTDHIVYQVGYFGDKDSIGNMVFRMDVYNFCWHEGAHAITDAILKKYRSQIDSLSHLMKAGNALQQQNINDWNRYFDELVARCVSIALHKEYRAQADYEKLLQNETNRGFIHAKDVSDIIYTAFVHEKKVSTFDAVFPLIFEMLRSQYKPANP